MFCLLCVATFAAKAALPSFDGQRVFSPHRVHLEGQKCIPLLLQTMHSQLWMVKDSNPTYGWHKVNCHLWTCCLWFPGVTIHLYSNMLLTVGGLCDHGGTLCSITLEYVHADGAKCLPITLQEASCYVRQWCLYLVLIWCRGSM